MYTVFNWEPRHEGVLESGVKLRAFLTLALDGGESSALRPGHFTPPAKEHLVPIG